MRTIAFTSIHQWRVRILFGLGSLAWALVGFSQDPTEYKLKVAFLYNFALFTEWPAEVGSTLNLCVVGPDPFGEEIDVLAGKLVGARTVAVQRKGGTDGLRACQIVFVPGASIGQLPRVLASLRDVPVLLVAESPGATRQGAMLNMKMAQGRVSFEANLEAARVARLTLSSKLLRLATEVIQ